MQRVIDRRKISCPRCGAAGSLSGQDDYYGAYLDCLICGWHGDADKNGYPVMVEIPPPPIRRRRRRKKAVGGVTGDHSEELSSESGLEPGHSGG